MIRQKFATPCSRNVFGILFVSGLLLAARSAHALDLEIRGFGDLVGSKTNSNYPVNSIGNIGNRLNVDQESRVGLNLSSDLGNRFIFSGQFIGEGYDHGKYQLEADWLFLTYRPLDGFAIRAGRQINPTFLYAEQINVGFTYLWVRLPAEVYGLDPLKSFNGLSVIYTLLKGDMEFKAQLFGGSGTSTLDSGTGSYTVSTDNNKGVGLSLSSDHFKLQMGYSSSTPNIVTNTPVPLSTIPAGTINGDLVSSLDAGTISIMTAGASFDWMKFVGITEFGHIYSSGALIRSSTGAYGTLGYHVLPSLTPYLTYAWKGNLDGVANVFPDPSVSLTPETSQHSWMVGTNYKASSSVAVKAEYMRTQENFADVSRNFGANVFTTSLDFVF